MLPKLLSLDLLPLRLCLVLLLVLGESDSRSLDLIRVLFSPGSSREPGTLTTDGAVGETFFADSGLVFDDAAAFSFLTILPSSVRATSLSSPAVTDEDMSSDDDSPPCPIARRTLLEKLLR